MPACPAAARALRFFDKLRSIVTRLEFTVDPTATSTVNPAGAEPDLAASSTGSASPISSAKDRTGEPDRLRAVVPGVLVVVLAGLVALVLRRQSRDPAV